MNDTSKKQIELIVNKALDMAEFHWENGGKTIKFSESRSKTEAGFESFSYLKDSIPTNLPGHTRVYENETTISEFIAFVADMRNSTNHLLHAISEKKAKVSQLQRVFYETSALLPALAQTVEFEGGQVTEYLGDGILAFFKVDETNKSESLYRARRAAIDSIGDTRNIINDALLERYSLPSLDIGVGLAMSQAIVSLVGLHPNRQAKAFGECVFRATKISSGVNEVFVDKNIASCWPIGKNGSVIFNAKTIGKGEKAISAYLMGKK